MACNSDKAGAVYHVADQIDDVTEQKEAEQIQTAKYGFAYILRQYELLECAALRGKHGGGSDSCRRGSLICFVAGGQHLCMLGRIYRLGVQIDCG